MTNDKGLETLQVWQKSLAFAAEVCTTILPKLPVQEKWSLIDQLRRSAQSIPANIAEGYGRFYFQESVRFCYIARGSLEETFSHLTLAHKLGYLNDESYTQLNSQIIELRRMINGYIAFLKESKRGASEPDANHPAREDAPTYRVSEETPNS
ncbi:MAG: four helix bundle protein [Anaerolineales bacterium]|nr:four helix bundle protein [Anaerolineales bacterium]